MAQRGTHQHHVVRRPRALLFDLDETLLDNSGIPESIARTCELVAALVSGLDPQQLRQANTDVWLHYWPTVEDLCWRGRMDGFQVSREAWRRSLRACGCADESVAQYAFEQYQRLSRDALRLFADAGQLLAHLARGGYSVALVTNGPSDLQRDKLRILGLADTFHAVVISGELGVAKPSTAPFQLALQRLGVEARDAWHIGDSLVTDVGGAQAAGVVAVWLNRDGSTSGDRDSRPDLEVTSLSEVVALLRQAQPAASGS